MPAPARQCSDMSLGILEQLRKVACAPISVCTLSQAWALLLRCRKQLPAPKPCTVVWLAWALNRACRSARSVAVHGGKDAFFDRG